MYLATKPDAPLIDRNDLAQVLWIQQVLWIHTCGERGQTNQIRKHHGDLAAFGGVLGGLVGC